MKITYTTISLIFAAGRLGGLAKGLAAAFWWKQARGSA